jgi:uncharacterized protein
MARFAFLALGWSALALGLVGVVLPGLPTTPFLLVAAFSFGKSSPRLRAWLVAHPRFGPPIRDWATRGAISRRNKVRAVLVMAVVVALSLAFGAPGWVLAVQAAGIGIGLAFMLTRPS